MGTKAWNDAEANRQRDRQIAIMERDARIREAAEGRAAERHGWEVDTRNDTLNRQRLTDDEIAGLTNPNFRSYRFDPTAAAPAMGLQVPAATPTGESTLPAGTGSGLRMSQEGMAPGLRVAPAAAAEPAGGYTNRGPLNDLERQQTFTRIAGINRDVKGLQESLAQEGVVKYDMSFKSHLKDFNDNPNLLEELAPQANTSKFVTVGKRDKNGMLELSVVDSDGRGHFGRYSKPQQAMMYAALKTMDMNPQKSMEIISGIDKTLAEAIAAENNLVINVTDKNNLRAFQGGQLDNQRITANAAATQARAAVMRAQSAGATERAQREALANQVSNVQYGWARGQDGNPVPVMQGMRFNKKTGVAEPVTISLNQGFVPMSALDPAKIDELAGQLIGKPIPGMQKDGKAVVFDAATAMEYVRSKMIRDGLNLGAQGGVDIGKDAQAILDMQRRGGAAPSAAPKAAGLPTPGGSGDEFNAMLKDAKRGGSVGIAYIRQMADQNELTASQRREVESILRR